MKKLTTEPQILAAQKLLHLVYVAELNWQPASNNPSRLKIVADRLIDDYDEHAQWYGVYDKDNIDNGIIATGRILDRDNQPRLELERYAIPQQLREQLAQQKNIVEINRSAIKKDYRHSNVWAWLLYAGFNYCCANNYQVISSTANQKVQTMHDSIGFLATDYSFKYDAGDNNDSIVYWVDTEQTCSIAKKLKIIANGEALTSRL